MCIVCRLSEMVEVLVNWTRESETTNLLRDTLDDQGRIYHSGR